MGKRLQFQGAKTPSIGPKVAITGWYVFCTAAAVWLTWFAAADPSVPGNAGRQAALLACVLVYIARAAYTLFVFVKRTVPWWEAVWGGSIIGVVLFFYLRQGLRVPEPLGALDGLAVLCYLTGSWLGTASEASRHVWKARPENRGHLYTEGLFRCSRHVNYLGDLLVFAGLALLTRQLWAGIVPLAMAVNFAPVIIPAHDAYLASRYGPEFEDYARRTRKLVPLLY